jgi:hypothetical protein
MSRVNSKLGILLAVAVLACALVTPAADAAQFRGSNRIERPGAEPEAPAGATRVEKPEPVPRKLIEDAVRELMGAWNTEKLERLLADSFFDRSRLLDAIVEDAPRDATIRILSIQNVQTLTQFTRPEGEGSTLVISTVSAVVRTQVEFNDPTSGFRRLEGTGEYLFEITMRAGYTGLE